MNCNSDEIRESGKQQTIEKAVNLAGNLPEKNEQLKVMAGILTFTDKVADNRYAKRLNEVHAEVYDNQFSEE